MNQIRTHIVILLYTLIIIITNILLNSGTINEYLIAVIVVMNFIIALLSIWTKKKLSMFFLFFVAFIFLFIGGRFFVCLGDDFYNLREGTFFYMKNFHESTLISAVMYMVNFIYFATVGYYCSSSQYLSSKPTLIDVRRLNSTLNILVPFVALMVVLPSVRSFITAISGGGYLSLYYNQEQYIPGAGIIDALVYSIIGIALFLGASSIKRKYLLILGLKALINILIGTRGFMGAYLLFLIWYYFRKKDVSLIKIFIFGIVALLVLLYIASLSIRNAEFGGEYNGLLEYIKMFLFEQGVSFAVFMETIETTDFPTLPYFSTFIPGSTFLYNLFTGENVMSYDMSWGAFLSYVTNSDSYSKGFGIGWTILGDLYLLSGRSILIFSILAFAFGGIIGYIENKAESSSIYGTILYVIFINMMLLPRGTISSIIHPIYYTLIIYGIIYLNYKKRTYGKC